MNTFDVGVVGAGVAGAFACLKLAKDHKSLKVIAFDIGRPPAKRRRQTEGWLGCFPNSDGKLYSNDLDKVSTIVDNRKLKSAHQYFNSVLSNVGKFKIIKDKPVSVSLDKKLKKLGYGIEYNDYIQTYPKDIHALSKYMASEIDTNKNIQFSFDNEIIQISKQKGMFVIESQLGEYRCKKIVIAVGRSGWRWAKNLYKNFGIIDNNDSSRFGIRVELNEQYMKDFNRSSCTISKGNIELGPLCWNGTVIPEDHIDLAISSFRSNENRWKTDKVSFNLIGNINYPNQGCEQTDRLGQLTFVLTNERILKERVSTFLNKKSMISIMNEYSWLHDTVKDVSEFLPEILTKASFHVPTIIPMAPSINIGSNLETEVENMFVVGESAGIHGILSAACMGIIVADTVSK